MLFPARDDLKRIVELQDQAVAARMVASRGCKFKCSFCTTPQFYGTTVRYRDPGEIVREMNYLADEFGVTHIWFNDDLFIDGSPTNTRWVSRLTDLLAVNANTFTFRILCRADSFSDRNLHVLTALHHVGLSHIFLGLEAGSQHSLDVYNKGYTPARALQAVATIKEVGIDLQIGFIMYNPYCTFADLRENVEFLHAIGELYRFFPLTRPLSVFPGTPIAARLIADGLMNRAEYREPLASYRYQDSRIQSLAAEMYHSHARFAWLDDGLHKAFKALGNPPVPDQVEKEISNFNAAAYNSILDFSMRHPHTCVDTVARLIEEWLQSLATKARELHLLGNTL